MKRRRTSRIGLFIAGRNLEIIGYLNFAGHRYYDETPLVDLKRFADWAVAIGWELPGELVELAAGSPVVDVPGEDDQAETEGEIYRTGLASVHPETLSFWNC